MWRKGKYDTAERTGKLKNRSSSLCFDFSSSAIEGDVWIMTIKLIDIECVISGGAVPPCHIWTHFNRPRWCVWNYKGSDVKLEELLWIQNEVQQHNQQRSWCEWGSAETLIPFSLRCLWVWSLYCSLWGPEVTKAPFARRGHICEVTQAFIQWSRSRWFWEEHGVRRVKNSSQTKWEQSYYTDDNLCTVWTPSPH